MQKEDEVTEEKKERKTRSSSVSDPKKKKEEKVSDGAEVAKEDKKKKKKKDTPESAPTSPEATHKKEKKSKDKVEEEKKDDKKEKKLKKDSSDPAKKEETKEDKKGKKEEKLDTKKPVSPTLSSKRGSHVDLPSDNEKRSQQEIVELSKPDESVMVWVQKLKKASRSRLLTIHNKTTQVLERTGIREEKAQWRVAPPELIGSNVAIQFGVEGKHHPEGFCKYQIGDSDIDTIAITWSADKNPVINFTLSGDKKFHVMKKENKMTEKFCDVYFEITQDRSPNETVETTSASMETLSTTSSSQFVSFPGKDASEAEKTDDGKSVASKPDSDSDWSDDDTTDKVVSNLKTLRMVAPPLSEKSESFSAALPMFSGPVQTNSRTLRRKPGTTPEVPRSINNSTDSAPNSKSDFDVFSSSSSFETTPTTRVTATNQVSPPPSIVISEIQEPKSEKPTASVQEVEEKTKNLMRTAFADLDKGRFAESLANVEETIKLFASLPHPSDKQKELQICANYSLALRLLMKKGSCNNSEDSAFYSTFLAQLPLQPAHRFICLRMCIKSNLEAKNFGVAAYFLEKILTASNLADRATQQQHLEFCLQNHKLNASVKLYSCYKCQAQIDSGHQTCSSCETPVGICSQSLELLSSFSQCNLCGSRFNKQSSDHCPVCHAGKLEGSK